MPELSKVALLEILTSYVNSGLSPIPVHPDNKRPLMNEWQQHHTTISDINLWIKQGRIAFGIVCGEPSGGLEIIDFDDYHRPGTFELWKTFLPDEAKRVLSQLPITRTQRGGMHVLFRTEIKEGNQKLATRPFDSELDGEPEHVTACGDKCNGGENCKGKRDKTVIETRGVGGQALEPPSPRYSLMQGALTSIPSISDEIRTAFFQTAKALSESPTIEIESYKPVIGLNDLRPGDKFNQEATWDEILTPLGWHKEFTRNSVTYWRRPEKRDGVSATTNYYGNDLLHVFSSNAYPFEADKSYSKFHALTILNHGGDFSSAAGQLAKQYGYEPVAIVASKVEGSDEEEIFKNVFKDSRNRAKGIYGLAEYLVSKHNIKTLGRLDRTREIYVFENGLYVPGQSFIKKEVHRILGDVVSVHPKQEVIETIKDVTTIDRSLFVVDRNLINLKNGVYDLKNKLLLPHNPKELFLSQLPINHDANATCPIFINFINEILDEDSMNVIQEWFGYILYRSYFIKKALICVGERDTGKTTLQRVMEKFAGRANASSISLQSISRDRFAIANLYNKHINIYDDLAFKDISDNGTFKMLTGGGLVSAEFKFGDSFHFENYAKLTFSCNKIPSVKEINDDAYFGRWLLIRFEHQAEHVDKFLFDKMTTEEELSGILNFALIGLERLLNKQEFSYSKTPAEVKKEMSLSASPLAEFCFNQLETVSDSNVFITKDDLYQAFIEYIKANDLSPISKETVGKTLQRFITVSDSRKMVTLEGGKKQVSSWVGVKFKHKLQPAYDVEPEPQQELVSSPQAALLMEDFGFTDADFPPDWGR
jgi:P4 family phage/plasmid primase-like protien